jgi:serine/threonine protein kinase
MQKMKHANIIRLFEAIDTTKYVFLVMEYMSGLSLHGHIKSKDIKRLDEEEAKKLFKQVVEGIEYCHARCITHRDIKLENLLLDD